MARFLPAAASALLALAGLPALAASPDGAGLSVAGLSAAGLSVAGLDAGELDGLDDLSAASMSPSDDAERAARRGKGGKKSQAKARGGGSRSSSAKARSSSGRSGGPAVMRTPAGRSGPAAVRTAPASSSPQRATAQRSTSQRSAAAQRSAPQRSSSNSSALRTSSQRSSSSDARRASSSSRSSSERAHSGHRSGSDAQRAGVGPRAANKVELARGNRGDARKGPDHARNNAQARAHHQAKARNHAKARAHHQAKARHHAKARHRHVVHHRAGVPPRWSPRYHRYHLRGVPTWHPRYWSAGVFVYNPPPRAHRVVVVDDSGNRVKGATKPKRAVNRNNSFAIGLRSGSYMSGYDNGGGYGDLGLGLAMRYRPHEAVGLELAWTHHNDSWDENTERAQDPLSASVELFAFPWTRVSPYALLGVTLTPRAADDTYANGAGVQEYQGNDALFGPHAGLGIEFAIGKKTSLNFDGRYIGYVDVQPGDDALPGAFQGNMGLNFHF